MNQNQSFSLSCNALHQLPFDKYAKNFLFVVDGRDYFISRFQADLISPIIRNMHFADDSASCFIINTDGQFPSCDFSSFLSLLSFQTNTYDDNTISYFQFLFEKLGNYEESNRIDNQELSVNNVVSRINRKWQLSKSSDSIQNYLDFAASHFSEIPKEYLKQLDPDLLDLILKHSHLKIDDEDTLLRFLVELYNDNEKLSFLFENVDFSKVSRDEFITFTNIYNFNNFTTTTWKSIIKRAIDAEKPSEQILVCGYQEGQELNGVFNSLTNKYGLNICTKGIINIRASSCQIMNGRNHRSCNIVDFTDLSNESMWSPNGEQGATLTFDFKDKEICLTHYTFHTPSVRTLDYPRSWIIEMSNDNVLWKLVDRRNNEESLNGFDRCCCFACNSPSNNFYRYVRIRSIGPCWNVRRERYYFDLSAVEFFGTLKLRKS